MYRLLPLIAAIFLIAGQTFGQTPPPPPPPGAAPAGAAQAGDAGKDADSKEDSSAGTTDGVPPLPGDKIFFKNGSKLEGVTVLRESPVGVEVKVTEADTLLIPRKQIDHIEYEEVPEAGEAAAADNEPSILKGQQISTELYDKLTAPLPDDSLEVKEQDLVEALAAVGKKMGVEIDVTDPVKRLPAKDRQWSTKLEPGAKLATLLETGLLGSFPKLKVEFTNDRIVISMSDGENAGEAAAN